MPLAQGDVFAGYTVVRLLGSGGMGEVYLAQHPRLPRHDAIKILASDVSADDEYRQRFLREAQLASTLWHPNIVRVNDRGEYRGQLWISMDYVDGTDAARELQDSYPAGMPADRVAQVVGEIAGALDYAHERAVLHRDVKPANILLTGSDSNEQRILLSDFGIARTIGDSGGLTATTVTVGTVPYAAPEQLMGEPIDGRADQYALAATAYHLLTGSTLFPGSNPVAVINHHINSSPPALAAARPELAALDAVLATALAKDPTDRFPTCASFARAFADATDLGAGAIHGSATVRAEAVGGVGPTSMDQPDDSQPDKTQTRHRRRILVSATLIVALLAVTGVAGYFGVWKHKGPPSVLDGTYQIDYAFAAATKFGKITPAAADPQHASAWSAFRTTCTSSGCVATSIPLDGTNHQIANPTGGSSEYLFVDNRWQRDPGRFPDHLLECSVENNKKVPGTQTILVASYMNPQPDGTLQGLRTQTILTNECGFEGQVDQLPYVVKRVGDVPPGISFPTAAPIAATSNAPSSPQPGSGPALNGVYRFDEDNVNSLYDGIRIQPDENKKTITTWWAFRSACTASGCAATGTQLNDKDHLESIGGHGNVLRYADGRWQDVPFKALISCATFTKPNNPAFPGELTAVTGWSLESQPDGTLKGFRTTDILTSDCNIGYKKSITTVSATRTGDVPPNIVLADPVLFLP